MKSKKILVCSPVRQKPQILKEFLESLSGLEHQDIELNFFFIDDNEEEESSNLLQSFQRIRETCLLKADTMEHSPGAYVCNDVTHYWKEQLIWRVAGFKDRMIRRAVEMEYDYLFLVDSDLLLYPSTIEHLIGTGKDIISEIFWTAWVPGSPELPNVWLYDHYDMAARQRGETLSQEEMAARKQKFLDMLKTPGVYEVGGLGACTLISRKALLAGVRFSEIKNLTLWGEDRHFCVRANALGLSLFADTHYPAYHIYRDSCLNGVRQFKDRCRDTIRLPEPGLIVRDPLKPKLMLSMVMKNEAGRYLSRVLEDHRQYIDQAVIIDDGSTDDSADICKRVLQGIPTEIIRNSVSKFSNEVELRRQQWQATVRSDPEWILNMDADEMFEPRFKQVVRVLLENTDVDLYFFRLYDLWDENHYRNDAYWHAHTIYRPFLFRYRPGFTDQWADNALHCPRFPKNALVLPQQLSNLRVKHLGWMNPKDRQDKYHRYLQMDPGSILGWKEQYESILDPNPVLEEWKE